MKRLSKLSLIAILVSSFILSPLFANKASAQWVVFDPANFSMNTLQTPVKDFGLDTVAWTLANIVLERIAASTVNWINSGFQGSPAFITDPDRYFKNLADGVAGQVIYNHPDLKFMCSPFRAQVQIALARTYAAPPRQFQCTLSQVVNNWDGFMNDFSQGGWDGFIEVTQNSQNNPLGLYLNMSSELQSSIANATGKKKDELNWGKGFFSYTKCDGEMEIEDLDEEGTPYKRKICVKEKTETPGTVIEDKLNQALGAGQNRIEAADEISEIISALMNQLMSKALGGLRGLSKGSSSQKSFTEQLYSASSNNPNFSTVPAVNGECPETYTLDPSNPTQCVTSSRVQTTLTNAQNTINQANNLQKCLIQASGNSTVADAAIIAACSSQYGSGSSTGSGSGTAPQTQIGAVTGPGATTGACGSLAGSYPAGTVLSSGNYCYNSSLATPINNISDTVPSNGSVSWDCRRADGSTFSCSATNTSSIAYCGDLSGTYPSTASGTDWPTSGSFCNNGAVPQFLGSSAFPTSGTSVTWTCPSTSGYSLCSASTQPTTLQINTSTGGTSSSGTGTTGSGTFFGSGGLGGTGTTGTGNTGTGSTGSGNTGNNTGGNTNPDHNPAGNAFYAGCGPAAGSYSAGASGYAGDACGTYATLVSTFPDFPAPGGYATWTCVGNVNGAYQYFSCSAIRAE